MVIRDEGCDFEVLQAHGHEDGLLSLRLTPGDTGLTEELHSFERRASLRPTQTQTQVYSWLEPESLLPAASKASAELGTVNGVTLDPARPDYRHDAPADRFGYRSVPPMAAELEAELRLRRALHQRDAVVCTATGTATQLRPGSLFELLDHPQVDLIDEYLVVAVEHSYGSVTPGAPDQGYRNRAEYIPAGVEWRPARVRLQPRIPGVHTATVVGEPGEEIHTDEHGRVRVQFHWDRRQRHDAGSSCSMVILVVCFGIGVLLRGGVRSKQGLHQSTPSCASLETGP